MCYRLKIRLFIIVAICFCATGFPQNRPALRSSAKPPRAPFLAEAKSYEETQYVTKVVFNNGMKVLVNEFKAQPLVSIQAYVNGGISDEDAPNAGMVSLLAAMINRGDTLKKIGTLRQRVQALGGIIDADTNLQNTLYEIVTPSAQWKQAVNAQAEALLRPVFDKETIKIEAELLSGMARGGLDDPAINLNEALLELAFDQPKLSKHNTLSKRAFENITPERIASFHKVRYVPSEITLVISGDVRSGEVLNELAKIYAKSENHPPAPLKIAVKAEQREMKYRAMYGNVRRPRLILGFHASSEKADDYKALEVLNAVLGLGEGSLINMRLRDQKKLISSATANLFTLQNSGYFSIELETDSANIDKCEIALLTEIELIKRNGPSEVDLKRAIAQLERLYWTRLETATGRAKMLNHFESLGDWKKMERYVSDLSKVRAADVQKAADRYLKLQNSTLVEFLPNAMKDRVLTSQSIGRTLDGLLEPSANQEELERSKEVVLSIETPTEGTTFKFSEIQYPFQIASILRGPDIFIREEHTSPLLDLGIFFQGGKFKENQENAGITELMLSLMLRGNPEKQGSRLQLQLEIYGGKIQPVVTDDYFGFYFSILSGNFEKGFKLLQEVIRTPNFDATELERFKHLQLTKVGSPTKSPALMPQAIREALFGSFSYAQDSSGSEASINRITLDAIRSWHADNVRNYKPKVIIIGDTKGTSLASYFVRQFSGSRMLDFKISEEYAPSLQKAALLEQSGSSSSSYILQAFQAPPLNDEGLYGAMLLQSYLGDLGRFPQEIRDRLGLAYEISLQYEARLRGGSIFIYAQVKPQNEEAVLKEIRREIQQLTEASVPYRDFQSAITSAVGMNIIKNQYRNNRISGLAEYIFAGKTLDDYLSALENIRNIKEEELKELVGRILRTDRSVLLRIHGVH
jgi:zinc protease